ncbi:MAG: hypothetical protein ACI89G_003193 [Minisyncoccia bacterium]
MVSERVGVSLAFREPDVEHVRFGGELCESVKTLRAWASALGPPFSSRVKHRELVSRAVVSTDLILDRALLVGVVKLAQRGGRLTFALGVTVGERQANCGEYIGCTAICAAFEDQGMLVTALDTERRMLVVVDRATSLPTVAGLLGIKSGNDSSELHDAASTPARA